MNLLNKLFTDNKHHLLAMAVFVVVSFVYFLPNFQGKVHSAEDVIQSQLATTEAVGYEEAEGKVPGWTNSIFSGMPSTLIKGKKSTNQVAYYNYLTPFRATKYPFRILLLSFIGFYIMLWCFGLPPLFSLVASLAYGFATYSISSIEAAHYTKVLAMALIPAIIGGMHLLFKGKYFPGFVTLAFNLTLQIYTFHYQITYYTAIVLLVMGVYYVVALAVQNNFKNLLLFIILGIAAGGIAVGSNIQKLTEVQKYSGESMRGGSALAAENTVANIQTENAAKGLAKDYAFSWSYGIGESFTLLIPGLYGGSSNEPLPKSSDLKKNFNVDSFLLYHGEMPSTSGPVYIGAILVFLFVFSLLALKDSIKWPLLGLTLLSLVMAWGGNFDSFNSLLFDYLPFYNKFRTPMMTLSIAQVTILLLAFLGVKYIWDNAKNSKDWLPQFKTALYITGGFCVMVLLIGPAVFGVSAESDASNLQRMLGEGFSQYGQQTMQWMQDDRSSLMRRDAFRSLAFILAAFGLIWAWKKGKLSLDKALILLGVLSVLDVVLVATRYLTWKDFNKKETELVKPMPTEADKAILADKDIHFRVFDLAHDPFNANDGAAFHKMIGGYHPAKLSRYQEVISNLITPEFYREKTLDMLNCKYIIGVANNEPMAQRRATALGNAWFVNNIVSADGAKAEMESVQKSNPATTAVFDSKFNRVTPPSGYDLSDSLATISLVKYHPDTMVYKFTTNNPRYAVFSEVWYPNWKAYVDGKPVSVDKVNYILRGLSLPAGSHTLKMVYEQEGVDVLATVMMVCSSLVLLFVLIAFVRYVLQVKKSIQVKS